MMIERIDIDGFRNLNDVVLWFDPGLNILYGENGAGKTNILEALWIMTGVKSFRGARDSDLYGYNRNGMSICITFVDKDRRQIITALYHNRKLLSLTANGVAIKTMRLSTFFGMIKAVIFTPEDLALVNGEPQLRRNFLNLSISQIRPALAAVITRYNRVLAQRNAYLKDDRNPDTEPWDIQLAKLGAHISLYRDTYTKMLDQAAGQIYSEISGGKERLAVRFYSSAYKKIIEESEFRPEYYYERLLSHIEDDRKTGATSVGIHRDDILLTLDDKPVREFASQGQQRSVALALKLAAAKILEVETGDPPVVFLDDVLSELDPSRQRYFLDNLIGYQTIITACEKVEGGKLFLVKDSTADEDPPRGGRPHYPK
ncbi:MAG: DNA replication and repair protein RecF [Ruminococcus sp.]|jgi:DNA replication and repair protein RecF|nr:DNA replication and repair protein RecF [Ruminococcus sp.]